MGRSAYFPKRVMRMRADRREAVLDFLLEAVADESTAAFPVDVLAAMRRVVRCETVSYREWRPKEMLEFSLAADQRTVAILRAHLARQAADRLAWGEAWAGSGLVFACEDGSPLHPGMVSNRFRRLAFAAGLPPVRLHDLRHGAATYALAAGVDVKVVQERLGHSTSILTRDTYTSVLPDVARAAAEAAAAMIPRAVSGTDGLPMDSQGPTVTSIRTVPGKNMQVSALNDGGASGTRTRNLRIKSLSRAGS
jgi:integrase